MSTSTTFTCANKCLLETAAQPKKKSEWFLEENSITQAWPGPWPRPLLADSQPPKEDVCQDLKPANTITESNSTAGSQCSGKDTQDLPPPDSITTVEETLLPPVQPPPLKPGVSSSPTHGGVE